MEQINNIPNRRKKPLMQKEKREQGRMQIKGRNMIIMITDERAGGIGIETKTRSIKNIEIKIGDQIDVERLLDNRFKTEKFIVRHITKKGTVTSIGLEYANNTKLSPAQRTIIHANKK